ncbi:prepilin-type N-terminal cleavage/methylation domain-containing protein [Desulfosoma sp.]
MRVSLEWRGAKRGSANGFTLVELVVVLLILVVGSSLVLVRVGSGIMADESRRFAVEFSQLMRKARAQAMVDGVPVAVCIDPARRLVALSTHRGALAIPGPIRIEADGLTRNVLDHQCAVVYPDGSASGGLFKISRNETVIARLQLDTVTGALLPYRVQP